MNERKLAEWIDRDLHREVSNAEEVCVLDELYQNPKRYAEYCDQVATARRIHDGVRAARVALPSDFFETRLKKAIDASPAWNRFAEKRAIGETAAGKGTSANVATVGAALSSERIRKTRGWFLTVGASAATVAVAATLGVWALGNGISTSNVDGSGTSINAFARGDAFGGSNSSAVASVSPSENMLANAESKTSPSRIPSSVSSGDVAVLPRFSEKDYWAWLRVDEKERKAFGGDFQRFCSSKRVAFEKFENDSEYVLKNVSPDVWRQIVDWLKERAAVAEREPSTAVAETSGNATVSKTSLRTSNAVDVWCADSVGKARDVRVSFGALAVASSDSSATP